jgi:hypothetical protein
MKFDINKILKIPKCPEYNNHAKEKWIELLGNAVYIPKKFRNEPSVLVEALDTYKKENLIDGELKFIPEKGHRWLVSERRLEILTGDNKRKLVFVKPVPEEKKVIIRANNSV